MWWRGLEEEELKRGREWESGIRVRGRHGAEIWSKGWRTDTQKWSRKWEKCFA